MRVLVVGDAEQPHTRRWAAALAGRGFEVLACGFGRWGVEEVPYRSLGAAELRPSRYPVAVPRLRSAVRHFRPDVVSAHFVSSYGLMADLAAGDVPVVQTAWGSDVLWLGDRARWHRALTHRALRRAALVTYDSAQIGARVASIAPGTPRLRVVFGPERSWFEVERGREERVVLSPRQTKPLYQIPTVIDAFADSLARQDGWRLEVLTAGAEVSDLRRQAEARGVAEQVDFIPRLDRPGVQARFAAAPVFLSVPASDGTSAALLEGMAAGSFPVVSDLPANREWVDSEDHGLVVPVGDREALTKALDRATADPALRANAARRNRARLQAEVGWEATVERLASALELAAG